MSVVSYTPTCHLRIKSYVYDIPIGIWSKKTKRMPGLHVIEQLFVGEDGSQEWRTLPVVEKYCKYPGSTERQLDG